MTDRQTLLLEAQWEMRRTLPQDDIRQGKKPRLDNKGTVESEVGRFDYSAVAQLGTGGVAGFLLTCNFRKEKTAIKEANQVLQQYVHLSPANSIDQTAPLPEEEQVAQLGKPQFSIMKLGCRGVVMLKLNRPSQANVQAAEDSPAPQKLDGVASADSKGGRMDESSQEPSNAQLVATAAEHLLSDIDSGKQKRLQHCQRIMPIQACCTLEPGALQTAAEQLASLVAAASLTSNLSTPGSPPAAGGSHTPELQDPQAKDACASHGSTPDPNTCISFAVAYKPRGSTGAIGTGLQTAEQVAGEKKKLEKETGVQQTGTEGGSAAGPEKGGSTWAEGGRMAVIHTVAGNFERSLRDQHGMRAKVDLKTPQWVILVEALPVMGSLYAALSVLPSNMCVLKPRLQVRPVGPVAQEK